MYLIIYIFILIITNKTTNMNYYAQQLELVAIDVGVDKDLDSSEFISHKKVMEKFNELKKESQLLRAVKNTGQALINELKKEINELKKENDELKKK